MEDKRQHIFAIGFLSILSVLLSLSVNAEAFTLKDREYLAEVLTSEFFKSGQVVGCIVADKNGTTLRVTSTFSPNIDALLFAFAAPDKRRQLKSYGFKKVVVQGIGWKNGVSQGVQNEKTILLK
jgi:hypothetical protein